MPPERHIQAKFRQVRYLAPLQWEVHGFAMPLDRSPDVSRIDVRRLSKTFQLAGTAIEAVRGVSFSVERGEFVALLGPSGSGKSTVLNMIATLIRPSGGEILIDGMPIVTGKATANVGYVF